LVRRLSPYSAGQYVQSLFHAFKCRLGLIKEASDDPFAESLLIFSILVVIHVEDLVEDVQVDERGAFLCGSSRVGARAEEKRVGSATRGRREETGNRACRGWS
jgi:hypothetical protein